jgi:hypothetical protein
VPQIVVAKPAKRWGSVAKNGAIPLRHSVGKRAFLSTKSW